MTTVLLVDDHPLFLDGVRAALSAESDLQMVGEAHDIADALKQAASHHPDVVLMDLNLPDGSGVDATRELLHRHPAARVLVITMSDTDDTVGDARRRPGLRRQGHRTAGAPTRHPHSGRRWGGVPLGRRRSARQLVLRPAAYPGRELSRAHRPRTRGPEAVGARLRQPKDQPHARSLRQDHPQSRLDDPRQLDADARADAVMRARRAGLGGQD